MCCGSTLDRISSSAQMVVWFTQNIQSCWSEITHRHRLLVLIVQWHLIRFFFNLVGPKLERNIYLLEVIALYLTLRFIFFCYFVSGFMIVMYIFETYLDMRQHSALKLPSLPKTLVGVISQEKFEKSRAYSLDKRFSLH